jgi:hypothetical protein
MKNSKKNCYKILMTIIGGVTIATLLQSGILFATSTNTRPTIAVRNGETAYPGLAKISMEDAKSTALKQVPGEALKVELEDENGFLVYGVEIVTPEKTITDVKIDAGTGKVLSTEIDKVDDNDEVNREDDRSDQEGDREDDRSDEEEKD